MSSTLTGIGTCLIESVNISVRPESWDAAKRRRTVEINRLRKVTFNINLVST
ncbi:MAG: hypothetical protein AAGH46_01775 [Bacteroidota bacterium]